MRVGWTLLLICLANQPACADEIPICERRPRAAPALTCLYDGDSGWQQGTHWHLIGVDAPEIDVPDADCREEQVMGVRALKRLRFMMAAGYTVIYLGKQDDSGRRLVRIKLADGRDAGSELMSAGLVQALPNTGEKWCDR